MVINRIYENTNFLSLWLVSFLVGLRTYQNPCTMDDLLPDVFCLMMKIFHLMLAFLYIYMYSNNTSLIMVINRIYENQNFLSLQFVSFLVGLRTYQHPFIACCRLNISVFNFLSSYRPLLMRNCITNHYEK